MTYLNMSEFFRKSLTIWPAGDVAVWWGRGLVRLGLVDLC